MNGHQAAGAGDSSLASDPEATQDMSGTVSDGYVLAMSVAVAA